VRYSRFASSMVGPGGVVGAAGANGPLRL
jgi:hypothetical protein